MQRDTTQHHHTSELRHRAEQIARQIFSKRPRMFATLTVEEIRMIMHELQIRQIELELHNAELYRIQTELEASRTRYFEFYDLAPVGFMTLNAAGRILEANLTMAGFLGIPRESLVGQELANFIVSDDLSLFNDQFEQLFVSDSAQSSDLRMQKAEGESFWALVETTLIKTGENDQPLCRMVISDITERKQEEIYHQLAHTILSIINATDGFDDSIQQILATIRHSTQCDAVGLRLQAGNDYPYFAERGFSADFLKVENTLIARDKNNDICRDENGQICLECTCGLVISGKIDPTSPLFTTGGSCYTNNSIPLLDLPLAQDPRRNPRNRCIHDGYLSVALVPIRTRKKIVGLLQLNSHKANQFSLKTIHSLEQVASHIGEALLRKQIEDKLTIAHTKLRAQCEQRPVIDQANNVPCCMPSSALPFIESSPGDCRIF